MSIEGPPATGELSAIRESLARAASKLLGAGFLTELGGNLSVRLPRGEGALITPSGLPKGHLRPEDMLEVDLPGQPVRAAGESGGARLRPSVEVGAHVSVYCRRPDVNAIIHGHPPMATEMADSDLRTDAPCFATLAGHGSAVPRLPPLAPGSGELAEALSAVLACSDVALLAGHGVFVAGTSLDDAVGRALALERACREALAARGAVP